MNITDTMPNKRFEPTPRHGTSEAGCPTAVPSMKPVAMRSAVLSRMTTAPRPTTRGSSAFR